MWVVDYSDYKFNFSRANDNLGIGVSLITETTDLLFFITLSKMKFFFDKGQVRSKTIQELSFIDQKK